MASPFAGASLLSRACTSSSFGFILKSKPFGFASAPLLQGIHSGVNAGKCPSLSVTPPRARLSPGLCVALSTATRSTPVSVGEKLPDATFSYLDKDGQVQTVTVSDLTKGKKAVFFAVPGAFTPTCSQKHLPGFVEKADELRAKGIDTIACIAVNDAFVMRAWGESIGVNDKVLLLSDGNRNFTNAMGVTVDLSDKPVGLGVRSRRYSLLADDGIVKVLHLEEGGSFTTSGADDILKAL